jgi:hypothetical protein
MDELSFSSSFFELSQYPQPDFNEPSVPVNFQPQQFASQSPFSTTPSGPRVTNPSPTPTVIQPPPVVLGPSPPPKKK